MFSLPSVCCMQLSSDMIATMTPVLIAFFLYHFTLPLQETVPLNVDKVAIESGKVTVQVSQSLSAGSIPKGASRVEMLRMIVTADCARDVQIFSVNLQRKGLGFNADIAGVYAMSDGRKLQNGQEISSKDGSVQLRFRSFVLPKCHSKQIVVYADFSPDASIAGEHRFELRQPHPFETDGAAVFIKTSVQSPIRRTAGQTSGVVSVEYRDVLNSIRYGYGRSVARILLSADSLEDHKIHAITFTNDGIARNEDLKNIYVSAGLSRMISNREPQLNGDRVRIVFDPPFVIKAGQNKLLTVHADVLASRRKTIRLIIEDPSDIEAVSSTRSFQ